MNTLPPLMRELMYLYLVEAIAVVVLGLLALAGLVWGVRWLWKRSCCGKRGARAC